MNARIVRFTLLLAVTASLMVAATGLTMASWNDTATSSGNTFASGNLDLKQSINLGPPYSDAPIVARWHAENMRPGQALGSHLISFLSAGTIRGSAIRVAVSNTDPDLARDIELTNAEYSNMGVLHNLLDQSQSIHIADADHDGRVTLAEFQATPLEGLPVLNYIGWLSMGFRFSPDADNDTQNRSDTTEFRFTLQQ
jgi:predicted ribosomally synthesized peptide with SipW-like signal peptide